MSPDKDLHLDENKLLWAVVDETALPMQFQEHLATCSQCRAAKERLEQNLVRLGRMTKRFSPLPRKRVSLPVEKPRFSIWWSWSRRSYIGAAVTVSLMIVIVWWSALFRTTPEESKDMLTREMWEADLVMTEASTLVENALPPVYLDICGKSDPDYDEEFMQFLIPSIENEQLSYDEWRGGVVLC